MSEQRTGSAAPAARTGGPGLKGLLRVGDHVGQSAGEAAQAIRRAGLRPGLERCFGFGEQQTGLVVEQDPPAGAELARNGLVRIYVAAPGGDADHEQEEDREAASTVEFAAEAGSVELDAQPADGDPSELDEPAVEPETEQDWQLADAAGEREADCAADERSPRAPSEEQLLALAERVFAERAACAQRPRAWPTRRLLAAGRRRLAGWRRRSVLVRCAWAMLALWLAVGVLAALLGGHGGGGRGPAAVRGSAHLHRGLVRHGAAAGATGHASGRPPRRPPRAGRRSGDRAGRAPLGHSGADHRRRAGRRREPAGARIVAAPTSGELPSVIEVRSPPAAPVARAPQPAVPGVPVPAPERESEQAGGGPFSP